jgi:hypothetical protein
MWNSMIGTEVALIAASRFEGLGGGWGFRVYGLRFAVQGLVFRNQDGKHLDGCGQADVCGGVCFLSETVNDQHIHVLGLHGRKSLLRQYVEVRQIDDCGCIDGDAAKCQEGITTEGMH